MDLGNSSSRATPWAHPSLTRRVLSEARQSWPGELSQAHGVNRTRRRDGHDPDAKGQRKAQVALPAADVLDDVGSTPSHGSGAYPPDLAKAGTSGLGTRSTGFATHDHRQNVRAAEIIWRFNLWLEPLRRERTGP